MPADAAACCCHARRLPAPSLPPTRFLMATVLMAGTPLSRAGRSIKHKNMKFYSGPLHLKKGPKKLAHWGGSDGGMRCVTRWGVLLYQLPQTLRNDLGSSFSSIYSNSARIIPKRLGYRDRELPPFNSSLYPPSFKKGQGFARDFLLGFETQDGKKWFYVETVSSPRLDSSPPLQLLKLPFEAMQLCLCSRTVAHANRALTATDMTLGTALPGVFPTQRPMMSVKSGGAVGDPSASLAGSGPLDVSVQLRIFDMHGVCMPFCTAEAASTESRRAARVACAGKRSGRSTYRPSVAVVHICGVLRHRVGKFLHSFVLLELPATLASRPHAGPTLCLKFLEYARDLFRSRWARHYRPSTAQFIV
ncbi:hypothetical protein C8J57DRAFT_1247697 [Mycena rebaudengoi]|nr:hypothetical protein C8J57DRAFT_1247697 [Mycena rebaudengoi]